ncbi:MAG TPA: TIGR01777 family protein, partial [Elusimicrobia bacterium]|nr:TIGR01777 family protein [Elusimicrobiota bacterium]
GRGPPPAPPAGSLSPPPGVQPVDWAPPAPGPWEAALDGADAVINLAGEPVAGGRWTEARKLCILQSRVLATGALVAAAAKAARRPKALLNGSAVGYYGDIPEGDADENRPPGADFLAKVCVCWEEAAAKAENLGLRVVRLRTGHVLGRDGGMLAKMMPPFQLFIGGPLGSGRQWLPWIHRHDEVEAILFCLENEISGPVNLCAPAPERMRAFCRELGKVLHRPSWAPAPAFALRLLLGEMAELVLGGQRAVPAKLTAAGFRFRYPLLSEALADLCR